MNTSSLLHIVERLEGLLGRLPEAIRKPILHELTPLKELFLQQRPPRLLFMGSGKVPILEAIETLFAAAASQKVADATAEDGHWRDVSLNNHGTISILDARDVDVTRNARIQAELNRQPPDIVLFVNHGEGAKNSRESDAHDLADVLEWNENSGVKAKVIAITFAKRSSAVDEAKDNGSIEPETHSLLKTKPGDRFLGAFYFSSAKDSSKESQHLMSILAREVPNEARVEMIRISRDREAQREVAQILVKSTAAVCTAIGAQPIPLADLPILTTLQLLMVSGIMYVSGRERSLRAATEFIGALGANVGVGMLFREGTRALLKFFPGWGNIICGMVAGAGTYAIGRAAIVFFLEGLSLKDARRVYLKSRKRPKRPQLAAPSRPLKTSKRRNKRLSGGE
jgi:uncharacterized protein (DUF697 family)